jgi:hypothetical protein
MSALEPIKLADFLEFSSRPEKVKPVPLLQPGGNPGCPDPENEVVRIHATCSG